MVKSTSRHLFYYRQLNTEHIYGQFLLFVYVLKGAFANSNDAFTVGNVSVLEMQTRLLFWA